MSNDVSASDFASEWREQANFRREKAIEFPGDTRNTDAAEHFEMLADAAEKRGVHLVLLNHYNNIADDEDKAFKMVEAQSQVYQEIGFSTFPETPNALIVAVIERAGFPLPKLIPPTPRGS